MKKERADYKTRFKKTNLGRKPKQQPVGVMLPADIDEIVRAMPNRSEFLRSAIIEKLERMKLEEENLKSV